jgi:hypothetical protein
MFPQSRSGVRLPTVKFNLWHIMIVVAIVAGMLAAFDVAEAVGFLIPILVVSLPIVLASPARRLGVAAWIVTLYPSFFLACLYATWFTAWLVLGHRPRLIFDDPGHISPIVEVPFSSTAVLFLGLPFALFLGSFAVIVHLQLSLERGESGPIRDAARVIIPLASWLLFLLLWGWDVLGTRYVFDWFID